MTTFSDIHVYYFHYLIKYLLLTEPYFGGIFVITIIIIIIITVNSMYVTNLIIIMKNMESVALESCKRKTVFGW